MKKLTLIACMSCLMLVSGCASIQDFMYDGGNYAPNNYFQNTTVSTILVPEGIGANYQRPKKYCVTPEDIRAYEVINARAQQREQQVKTQNSSSSTVPTTTNPTINKSVDYNNLMGAGNVTTEPTITAPITPTPSMAIPSTAVPKVIIPPTPLPSTTTNNSNATQYGY